MPQAQNERGEWVPAVPLPLFGLRKHCTCGRKFWTLDSYRGHYALVHILGMRYKRGRPPTPEGTANDAGAGGE